MVAILEGLGEIGFILLAALVLIAAEVLGAVVIYPIAKNLSSLPFGLGGIGDGLRDFWQNFTNELQTLLDVQVKNLSDLIAFVSGSIQLFFNAATTTAEWLGIQIDHAFTFAQGIGGDLAQGVTHLTHLINQAVDGVTHLAVQVNNLIADTADKIAHAVNHAIVQVETEIKTWADTEIRSITDPIARAVQQFHDGLQHKLEVETNRASQMEAQLAGDITTAKRDVAQEIKAVRKALQGKIGNVEGTLEGELKDITDIIGTVAAGTTLVGLITTVATDLTRMERECVDPTCGYFSPQLPTLNAIGDIATAAAFAAFVGFAVQNPKGAADAVSDTVNGLEGIFAPLFSGMSGLHL